MPEHLVVVFIVPLWMFVVDKSYVKFVSFQKNAGLWHHTYNVLIILKYAYHNNKIPIIPMFEFGEPEGMGSEKIFDSNLSEYYDYSKLKINGKPYEVVLDNEFENHNTEVFDLSKSKGEYVGWFPGIKELEVDVDIDVELPLHDYLINTASNVTELLRKYVCVHVRRGDVLSQHSNLDESTKSENILKVLDELIDESYSVYIMTNEFDLTLFDSITEKYDTYFYTDFEELKELSKDNYKLFGVELLIMKSANKKVSTFHRNYIYDIGYCDRWLYAG